MCVGAFYMHIHIIMYICLNVLFLCVNRHIYTLYTLITTFHYLFCLYNVVVAAGWWCHSCWAGIHYNVMLWLTTRISAAHEWYLAAPDLLQDLYNSFIFVLLQMCGRLQSNNREFHCSFIADVRTLYNKTVFILVLLQLCGRLYCGGFSSWCVWWCSQWSQWTRRDVYVRPVNNWNNELSTPPPRLKKVLLSHCVLSVNSTLITVNELCLSVCLSVCMCQCMSVSVSV